MMFNKKKWTWLLATKGEKMNFLSNIEDVVVWFQKGLDTWLC